MNPKKIRKEWHTRAHPEHDRLLFAAVHIQCADRIRTDCIISMIISKCVYSHVLFPFLQCCELILFFGWFVLLCFRYVFSLWLSEFFEAFLLLLLSVSFPLQFSIFMPASRCHTFLFFILFYSSPMYRRFLPTCPTVLLCGRPRCREYTHVRCTS